MRRSRPHRSLGCLVLSCCLVAAGAPRAHAARLLIVHSNDIHGHAMPYGDDDDLAGMARMATVVKAAKASEPNTLFLNAGDTFEGTMFFNAGLGEFDFKLMEAMGCDGLAVGNHDFAMGAQNLFNSFTTAAPSYPYLACNINLTNLSTILDPLIIGNETNGTQDATPYVVKVMPNGVRVGMLGVVTSETASIQPESTADGVLFYGATSVPTVYQVLQPIVNRLRTTEAVDIVILVSHEGLTNSSASIEDDTKIANNVTGIDLIIGGHDHVARPAVTTIGSTVLVYAGAFSRYVGALDLDVDTTTNTTTVTSYALQELNKSVAEDPVVKAQIDGYKAAVEAKYPGAYSDPVARNRSFMNGNLSAENGLGDFVTDAFRIAAASDIGLEVNGSLRFDTFRGNLYPAEIFNVLSLDYTPALGATVPLKKIAVFGSSNGPLAAGQPLMKAVLELLVSNFLAANLPSAGAAQMSGVTFEWDGIAADFSRVSNIQINGQPFDPLATYVLGTSENVAQQAAAIDALFGLTGQPNSFATNMTSTTVEPWQALRDRFDAIGRTTCPDNAVTGRYRTLAPDLAFVSDCAVDVEPRYWRPNDSVTFNVEVSNFGMTASAPASVEVWYEQSPNDSVPNLVQAATITLPVVAAWNGGTPGRTAVTGTYTVPAALPAGPYPIEVRITGAAGQTQTLNDTMAVVMPPRGNVVAGRGAGSSQTPEVRVFDADGAQVATFLAYGAGGYGVDVAAGDVDGVAPGRDEMITGPGPGPVYGPQVRGFRGATPIAKINYYAYGTLRYGVRVGTGDVDGDGYDEILTGAGQGPVFGPHVRGWNFDGATLSPIAKISFYAYATLKYGVEVGGGEYDRDGFHEIGTAPGPGAVFGSQIRAFNFDNAAVTAIAKVNFFAFAGSAFGATLAWSDFDGDGYDELMAGKGPALANDASVRLYNLDGGAPALITTLTPYTSLYGANVGPCERDGMPWNEGLTAPGPDPASSSADAKSYRAVLHDTASGVPQALVFTAFANPYGCNVYGGYFGN